MSHIALPLLSHVSLGTNDFERATAFYDAVMPALGCKRLEQFPGAAGYGREYPEFWIQTPINGAAANVGNGTHIGFTAANPAAVQAFYDAALAAGATADGAPGPRPEYGEPYFGCFVHDPDGHKIEAAFWDLSLEPQQPHQC
ncbi:VOC family protein [Jeongeupia naejangsanensis]|uniref:VOC family protein n=1 Tax=Jeongeupia naejangsanensis TaxID=613195 RepID=A0ABS2BQL8_9NEIS|nr:VOC family protein [Jeongeupia naejangsanensis]MBM3117740.1 VOC family protein [Jeongeupia naejangsanensis]